MSQTQDGFPLDEVTLTLLIESCRINPDSGRTHLHDFLSMGEREKSRTLIGEGSLGGGEGAPIYEVEFEKGYEPFSPNQVIITLAEEVLRLRAAESPTPSNERPTLRWASQVVRSWRREMRGPRASKRLPFLP